MREVGGRQSLQIGIGGGDSGGGGGGVLTAQRCVPTPPNTDTHTDLFWKPRTVLT